MNYYLLSILFFTGCLIQHISTENPGFIIGGSKYLGRYSAYQSGVTSLPFSKHSITWKVERVTSESYSIQGQLAIGSIVWICIFSTRAMQIEGSC